MCVEPTSSHSPAMFILALLVLLRLNHRHTCHKSSGIHKLQNLNTVSSLCLCWGGSLSGLFRADSSRSGRMWGKESLFLWKLGWLTEFHGLPHRSVHHLFPLMIGPWSLSTQLPWDPLQAPPSLAYAGCKLYFPLFTLPPVPQGMLLTPSGL